MVGDVHFGSFAWDKNKENQNIRKHRLDFVTASEAFFDSKRIIAVDEAHSKEEERFFCIGKVQGNIATVRFTYREEKIRIIGAGFWRTGEKLYAKKVQKTTI